MFTRNSFTSAWGALLGLALTTATLSAVSTGDREYVTFSGPVALPGVTLGPGTYIFEVAKLMGASDLILVRNKKANTQKCFIGFTKRIDRPAGLRPDQSVVLGEAPRGVAPPILAWFPFGDSTGHEFIYKRAR
jgi:hypothetical protein